MRKYDKEILESLNKLKLNESEDRVTKKDLEAIEKYADRLFNAVGIDVNFTKHFLARVNDERNKKQITKEELKRLFREAYKKYGKKISKLGDDAEAVLKDMRTDINVPFILKWNKKEQEFDLVAKTVMRKKNFLTTSLKLAFEDLDKFKKVD